MKCCICNKKRKIGHGGLFTIPKGRRIKWSEICGLNLSRNAVICMDHFPSSSIAKLGGKFRLLPEAVPMITTPATIYNSQNIDCENQEDVLGENLVNINNNFHQENSLQQMSYVKAESRTLSTQTNTRLCGTVEISDFSNTYRFNCFYCCQTFPLKSWKKFITHLNKKHYEYEQAFESYKYVSNDHDYTPINAKLPSVVEAGLAMKSSQIETLLINPNSILPHLVDPLETTYKSSNKSPLHRNLYKAENEKLTGTADRENTNSSTVTEVDLHVVKPVIGKQNIINVSTNKVMEETSCSLINQSEKKKLIKKITYQPTKRTIENTENQKQITTNSALSRCLKRSNTIETLDALEIDDECKASSTVESFQQKTTELSFEYTPRDIIDFLLDNIQNYAVLWEFDECPFNDDYYEAIEELCRIINEKWSLNIDTLKMRRSVNRVFRFFCSLYPCENLENINQFTCYYDKCALFLPASVHDIAYARCSHCYRCYKNDSDLKAHLLEEQRYLQWPFKCVECKECFRDNDEYELHRRLPHYQEVFRCQLCNRRYTQRNKYNRHVAIHQIKQSDEPGKYVCNVCGKIYKVLSELQNHKVYHGEKKHKCHLCPKKYFSNARLVRHIEAHNKEYRLMCEVCGKGFINHNSLREHMNKHTGAKVTCNICNLKLRKSSLSRHLRLVHVACEGTIETTYRARTHHYRSLLLCPKKRRFKNRRNYINYNCKICNIHFERYKYLLNHNKEYHSDAPKMSCKLCSSEFKHKVNLKRHYRVKHDFHVYQVYKLIEKNEDLDTVLSINKEELDKLCETLAYSTEPGPSSPKYLIDTTIVKSDASSDDIDIEEERLIDSDVIQDEIMSDADNINMSEHEIKIDDDHYMNDFFTNLLK